MGINDIIDKIYETFTDDMKTTYDAIISSDFTLTQAEQLAIAVGMIAIQYRDSFLDERGKVALLKRKMKREIRSLTKKRII